MYKKKKNGYLMVVFCAMLFMLLIVPNNVFANVKKNSIDENNNVKEVMDFVSSEKELFGIENSDFDTELVRELYHTDDSILAYYYQIKENGKLKGFVLASAKQNNFMLEYGAFEDIDTKYADILLSNLDKKAYFIGLDWILFANNGKELVYTLNETKDSAIENAIKNGEDSQVIREMKNQELGVNIEQMETLSVPNSDISLLNTPNEYSLDITRLWQRDPNVANPDSSCGPAAGAMIANYYGMNLGYNVRTTYDYANVGTFINHLYFEMNSHTLGTNSYSFLNGMQVHLNHDMSGWQGVRNGTPTFSNVINAINQHYPVAYVSRWVSFNEEYHWRVIKGYNKSNNMIIYKDPDGGQSNYLDRYVSWSLIESGFTTVYFRR